MKKTVICQDVFGNNYETPVEDLHIRLGIYAIIIQDNKILLSHQWDGYGLIGGGLEKGETVEEALIREVKEETGLDICPGEIIYQTTKFFKRNQNAEPHQSVQLYFTHSKLSGNISTNGITQEEKQYTYDIPEWVDLNDLNKITFRHSVSLDTLIKAYQNYCLKTKKEN